MSRSAKPKTHASKGHATPKWLTPTLQLGVAFLSGLGAAGLTYWLVSVVPLAYVSGISFDAPPNNAVLPAVQVLIEAALTSMVVMGVCVLVLRKLGRRLSPKEAMSVIFSALVFGSLVMVGSMMLTTYMFNDGTATSSSLLLSLALVASGAAFATAWTYGLSSARKNA
jgi:hypothetical protein